MAAILRILILWALLFGAAQARWVATLPALGLVIKPVVGEVAVLLPAGQSPHHWQLRPSQLKALAQAEQVALATPVLERPVFEWLDKHGRLQRVLIWSQLPGVRLLEGEHHHHHDDGQAHLNPHLWLSPHNARVLMRAAARRADTPASRLDGALKTLDQAVAEAEALLAPVRSRPFLVLHDAFAYFERDFGLNKTGVIELDANGHLGLRRLLAMRARIEQENIRCIVYPAHESPRLLRRLTKGLAVRLQPLDALGWQQQSYTDWLVNLAQGYRQCLK